MPTGPCPRAGVAAGAAQRAPPLPAPRGAPCPSRRKGLRWPHPRPRRGQGGDMPTYMVQASYTSTAWSRLVQRPENRMEALRPVIEKLGGKLHAWYYCWGDYDVVVLFDVPDNVNAAAASMAVAAGGAVKDIKTTPLMSPDEGFDAMLLAQGAGYRPPGA